MAMNKETKAVTYVSGKLVSDHYWAHNHWPAMAHKVVDGRGRAVQGGHGARARASAERPIRPTRRQQHAP